MSAAIGIAAAIITLIVVVSALVGWFAPDSIRFLFVSGLVVGLTITCLKENTYA